MRKVIAYLKTKHLWIVFVKDGDLKLSVYVDADHAQQGSVFVGGTVVNASSTTQHCVMLSTSEAE